MGNGFEGDLADYDMDDDEVEYVRYSFSSEALGSKVHHITKLSLFLLYSDDPLRGPVQELDLGSSSEDEDDEPEPAPSRLKGKKSKQAERPAKIIPTGSDSSDSDSDNDEDEDDGPVTIKNMEARSRALDAKAAREAELDMEEMHAAEEASDDDLLEGADDEEGQGGEDGEEAFVLPTAEEREEEKKTGGPQVHVVQRRMRECVRVLGNFKRLGAKGRSVYLVIICVLDRTDNIMLRSRAEYIQQLVADIANYYGYNEFLAEKLFQLFPISEVRLSWLLLSSHLSDYIIL